MSQKKEDTHASSINKERKERKKKKEEKKEKRKKRKKKEDTHASSIILQVAEQYGPIDAGPAGLN